LPDPASSAPVSVVRLELKRTMQPRGLAIRPDFWTLDIGRIVLQLLVQPPVCGARRIPDPTRVSQLLETHNELARQTAHLVLVLAACCDEDEGRRQIHVAP